MSLMQRRRAADGVDGGEDAADERTADQMMADLMEDLNNSSSGTTAVRSVRCWKEVRKPNLKVELKWLELVAHSQVITGEPKV